MNQKNGVPLYGKKGHATRKNNYVINYVTQYLTTPEKNPSQDYFPLFSKLWAKKFIHVFFPYSNENNYYVWKKYSLFFFFLSKIVISFFKEIFLAKTSTHFTSLTNTFP